MLFDGDDVDPSLDRLAARACSGVAASKASETTPSVGW
jgi:hypothetical protein